MTTPTQHVIPHLLCGASAVPRSPLQNVSPGAVQTEPETYLLLLFASFLGHFPRGPHVLQLAYSAFFRI